MHKANSLVTVLLMAAMLIASLPARAGIVGTEQMVMQEARAASLSSIENVLAKDEVAAQLQAWGVTAEAVAERVAALSDVELQQLVASMEADPAGGVLAVLGVVLVVLIVLEIVGVTNIFRNI
ncbi:MAG: PA2779 family protein [Pseudomonadales bacterium]